MLLVCFSRFPFISAFSCLATSLLFVGPSSPLLPPPPSLSPELAELGMSAARVISRARRGPVADRERCIAVREVFRRSAEAGSVAGGVTWPTRRGRRRGRGRQADAMLVPPVYCIANPRGPGADGGRLVAGGEVLWRSRAAVDAAGTSLRCRGRRRGISGNA